MTTIRTNISQRLHALKKLDYILDNFFENCSQAKPPNDIPAILKVDSSSHSIAVSFGDVEIVGTARKVWKQEDVAGSLFEAAVEFVLNVPADKDPFEVWRFYLLDNRVIAEDIREASPWICDIGEPSELVRNICGRAVDGYLNSRVFQPSSSTITQKPQVIGMSSPKGL